MLQNDIDLIHEIEADVGKKLEKFECKENDVLAAISKVKCFLISLPSNLSKLYCSF